MARPNDITRMITISGDFYLDFNMRPLKCDFNKRLTLTVITLSGFQKYFELIMMKFCKKIRNAGAWNKKVGMITIK